jgi:hypothetical protein
VQLEPAEYKHFSWFDNQFVCFFIRLLCLNKNFFSSKLPIKRSTSKIAQKAELTAETREPENQRLYIEIYFLKTKYLINS